MHTSAKQLLVLSIAAIDLFISVAANANVVVTCTEQTMPFTMATLSAGAVTCWYGGLPPNGTYLMLPGANYMSVGNNWKKVHGYGYSCDYGIANGKNTDCPVTQK